VSLVKLIDWYMCMSFGDPRVWFELQFVEHGCKDACAIVLDIIAGAAQCKSNHPKQVRRHPSKLHCCLQGRSNHPGDVPHCARPLSFWTYLQVNRRHVDSGLRVRRPIRALL